MARPHYDCSTSICDLFTDSFVTFRNSISKGDVFTFVLVSEKRSVDIKLKHFYCFDKFLVPDRAFREQLFALLARYIVPMYLNMRLASGSLFEVYDSNRGGYIRDH
jgi:hypothetical protein